MDWEVRIPSLNWLADKALNGPGGASRENDDDFGGTSFDEAVARARYGWPERARQASRMLKSITAQLPMYTVQNATIASVTGAYVDVGAYTEGIPESMVDFLPDKRRLTHVQIRVSGGYNCGVAAQQATLRGIAIAAIVDLLESKGIRCTVVVWVRIQGNGDGYLDMYQEIKSASQPLNLDALVFALGQPPYFRRLIFGLMETFPKEVIRAFNIYAGGGYGHTIDIPNPEDGTIVYQTLKAGDRWTEEYAVKRALATLRQLEAAT